MSTADIKEIVMFCVGFVSTVAAIVVAFNSYNTRKVAEAKEKSVGQDRCNKLEERIKKMEEKHDEFREDIWKMLFQPRHGG